jgi:hypothetical protein
MLLALSESALVGNMCVLFHDKAKNAKNIPTVRGKYPMKINQVMAICGIAAALCLSAGSVSAQNDNGGGGGGGRRGGGPPDPAQMQQRFMDRVHEDLGFTNATEWSAVQPLFQKVFEAQRDARSGMGRMFRGNRNNNSGDAGGGGGQGRGGFFGTPSPDAEALQKVIDDNAPSAQIKAALAKYQASQKAKQAKLATAQENLRKVLNTKQEAQATLMGLLE